jgi:3-methyladenine DNA glycosylase AlkD
MKRNLTFDEAMAQLYALENPINVAGQQRFGIRGEKMLGASIYDLRKLARGVRDHELALRLWETGIHDARLLATLVDDPELVTNQQMNRWVGDFDSWDICDQATDNLFIYVDGILDLIPIWAARDEEFVRRAAFATMAAIAWHGRQYPDEVVARFLPLIEQYARDNRNFVKKAVNWALRNIGKMRPGLREQAIACAKALLLREEPSARWIARDALKEFEKKFGSL